MNSSQNKNANPPKRRKTSQKKANNGSSSINTDTILSDGHMTAEEVERHLQSRQSLMGLVPPATVPTEMFSNEPSLDRLISNIPLQLTARYANKLFYQFSVNRTIN